jgi:hypothetical protein
LLIKPKPNDVDKYHEQILSNSPPFLGGDAAKTLAKPVFAAGVVTAALNTPTKNPEYSFTLHSGQ